MRLYCFACFVLLCRASSAANLPPYVKKCKLADPIPVVSECLRENANIVAPLMTKPIPDLRMPSVEPIRVKEMKLNLGNSGNFGLNAVFSDIRIHGLSTGTLTELIFDINRPNISVVVQIPKIDADCSYDLDGSIYLLSLKSDGIVTLNFTDVEVSTHLKKASVITKGGKRYLNIEEQEAGYAKFASGRVYFSNLVKDNPQLTKQLNGVLNENFMEIAKELESFMLEGLGTLLKPLIKPIYDDLSLDELFD